MTKVGCDDVDYFDANIRSISLSGARMLIDVDNLTIGPGHVWASRVIRRAAVRFDGVSRSVRTIRPYLQPAESGVFGEPRVIADIDSATAAPGARTFHLEGRLVDPPAWIHEWEIVAAGCDIEILEM